MAGCGAESEAEVQPAPPAYAASEAGCARCHPTEFKRWSSSNHHGAMQVASEESVLGDFRDASLEHFGSSTRFFRDGQRFMVNAIGADGLPHDFEVSYTFGVEPLQQYLIEFPDGRMQCLPEAWDTSKQEWFHLYPDERIPAGDQLHWTGPYQRWNSMCADCHSTDLKRGFDASDGSYETTWSELTVGCQACHGPGAKHVAWAEAGGQDEGQAATDMGLMANLRRWAQEQQINACAPCHSRRSQLLVDDDPTQPFLDRYLPERLHAGYYYPDGQVLDEVYVYGSFAQSKMYQRGVACTDCHDPHATEMLAEGNALCNQCHSTQPDKDRFPTLKAKNYDTEEHHHHSPGSAGSLCVNCHMPETTYMQVDARRDHSMRIPRPDVSEVLGIPNACNRCHTKETPAWAREAVQAWTGGAQPAWHFGVLHAAAQAQVPEAKEPLMSVAMDPELPAIVRATSLELLAAYGNSTAQAMLAACDDPNALVRQAAVSGLAALPADARTQLLTRLLRDPVRVVRIEAARVLADVPRGKLPEADREPFDAAFKEFLDAQRAQADLPASHLNLGIVRTRRGEHGSAMQSYRKALEIDPNYLPARFNLANLLNSDNRNDEAVRVLQEGIRMNPGEGELYHSLGLLLNEMGRKEEAAKALSQAAERLPERPRIRYNLGLLMHQLGHLAEAEAALSQASLALPDDGECLHALILVLVDMQDYKRALPLAERLSKMAQQNPTVTKLLGEIQSAVAAGR